jgi:four helix bundle protein
MVAKFEELRVLKSAEECADAIWKLAVRWADFPKDTVGKQFTRAADSIGANIAEAFGRFHYGERLQFLCFARGSLFESNYWLNRAASRNLLDAKLHQTFTLQLSELARQLNAFAAHIKSLRNSETKQPKTLRETAATYWANLPDDFPSDSLFDESELLWLESQ